MSIQLEGNKNGYTDIDDSNICICKTNRNGIVLVCHSPTCPYHNRIHPECFNLSEAEIDKALSSNKYLCPHCASSSKTNRAKRQKVKKMDSDEEFEFIEDDMGDMPSDEEYRIESESETEVTEIVRKRPQPSYSYKGHPWSDSSDDERPKRSNRSKARTPFREEGDSEGVRRSTRIRRSAHTPQGFVDEIILEDSEEEEEVSSTRTHSTVFNGSDSGSTIERILGRRVLAGTPEAEELSRRSRLAIGLHVENESVHEETDFDNTAFEYLVKWRNKSYLHLSWLKFDALVNDNPPHGKSRVYRFVKMLPRDENGLIIEYPPNTPEDQFFNPNYCEIERIVTCNRDWDDDVLYSWHQGCNEILNALCEVSQDGFVYADPFMFPVDEERDGAPDYYKIVEHPMCLSWIMKRLSATEQLKDDIIEESSSVAPYSSAEELFDDLELIFKNCHLYNQDSSSDIVMMCDVLEDVYRQKRALFEEQQAELNSLQCAMKECGSQIKYLVKWVDLSYKDCTWEDPDTIPDEVIKKYNARQTIAPWKLQPPKTKAERVAKGEKSILHFKDNKTLRPYQWEGFRWLKENYNQGKNSILADEMGLGKTIQVISLMEHIMHNMETQQPILVIAPLSTLGFWRREIEAWTTLNPILYHDNEGGKEVRRLIERYEWYYTRKQLPVPPPYPVYKFDVLITTYEIANTDVDELKNIRWSLVVIDEAQRMKNKTSKLQQTLRLIHWQQCVLLTGTPLQNNMMELWTLLNFVAPQTFPSSADFLRQYGDLQNQQQVASLQRLLVNYVLRRMKEDVEDSIPPKEETIIDVELTTKQKAFYRAIYDHNRDFFIHGYVRSGSGVVKVSGSGRGPRLVSMEMQFRKCCNHPYMLEGVEDMEREELEKADQQKYKDLTEHPLIQSSGKMVLLHKLLGKLKAEGHRVLIFSQFTTMLDLIERYLRLAGHSFTRIDGSVRGSMREDAIRSFNNEKSNLFCFLLSTRAGGVGITLTTADTVIIFDSDWNPQNDVQAQARCHRIGQTKAVRVYRLITRGTYESAMFQRASMKLGLEQAVMANSRRNISADVVETLLKEGAYSVFLEDKEGDERSRVFCESNINELLEKQSRVVTYDKGSTTSLFSKTSFVSSNADSKLDINDPLFWKKIYGEDTRETILERLEDGRATKNDEAKAAYIQELITMGDETIAQKLSGENVPDWYEVLRAALKQVTLMTDQFSEEDRVKAQHMLHEVERPSRKRKQLSSRNITEDSYSLSDPDFSVKGKSDLDDEVCCNCFRDYYLIRCTGPCRRCFHPECTDNPPLRKQRDTWKCTDCLNHKYKCGICHQEGYDADYYQKLVDDGQIVEEGEVQMKRIRPKRRRYKHRGADEDYEAYGSHSSSRGKKSKQNPLLNNPNVLFKCLVKSCGHFYHVSCIQNLDYGSKEHFSDLTHFRCPSHFCSKCHETGNTKHLVQCVMCCRAMHVSCLTSEYGHRISKLYYICNAHPIPKGVPSWDAKKKQMITDDLSFASDRRREEVHRPRTTRTYIDKHVYEPINYAVPIEEYKGNWCRYCGARRSSGFMKGPWGPKTLCVVHYVAWYRTKKLDLSAYPETPKEPINIEANSEPKYMYYLKMKKEREL